MTLLKHEETPAEAAEHTFRNVDLPPPLPPAEDSGGFGPGPARHRVRLQRQDELHDAV